MMRKNRFIRTSIGLLTFAVILFFQIFTSESDKLIASTKSWDGTISTEYSSGDGTATNPYIIETPEQFAGMVASDTIGKYYELANDIDLGGKIIEDSESNPVWGGMNWFNVVHRAYNDFKSYFDGKGYIISGFYNDAGSNGYDGGLVSSIASGYYLKNFSIKGYVTSDYSICSSNKGLLMNINNYTNCQFVEWNDGTISRCNSYGKILGNLTGSMCKDNRNTVECCNNYGEINGQSCVGGIAYYNSGKINKCNNYGDIYGGTQSTGGIASSSSATLPTYTISNCSNYGNISSSAGTVGGIVGNGNGASIENCRNLGNINGNSDVSGIGKNINATRCYAICNLSGKNCCGIDCYNNEYMSCYYAGNTTKISPSSSASSYSFNFSGMDIDTVNSKINVLNGGFDYYKINTSLNYQNGYPVFIEDENRYDIEFEESEYGAASVDVPYSIAGEDIEINIDTISKYTSTNITIYDGELQR